MNRELREDVAQLAMTLRSDIGRLASMGGRVVSLEERVALMGGAELEQLRGIINAKHAAIDERLGNVEDDLVLLDPGGATAAFVRVAEGMFGKDARSDRREERAEANAVPKGTDVG